MKFWTVDAFTSKPFHGNPAAVILVDEFPEDSLCQSIAAEFNLSETGFLKPLSPNHYQIRWFTPTTEIPLCGHGTLSSALVLRHENLINPSEAICLESLSGPLSVLCQDNQFVLNFPLQKIGKSLETQAFCDLLDTPILTAQEALDILLLELPHETNIYNFQVDLTKICLLPYRGLIITAASNGQPHDFVSRFFTPKAGINEDPVTGSAHCKLADYWQTKLGRSLFLAYQASPRGGEMQIKIEGERVLLTGKGVLISTGQLYC